MFYDMIYKIVRPLVKVFYNVIFFAKSYGRDNIPKDTGVIICGNHTSNHDGPIVAAFTPRQMNFIVKKEIFKFKVFSKLLYGLGLRPVERDGSDIAVVKAALSILKNNGGLVIFPEGTRNLKDINDAKDGAVVMAIKTQVPIIPVRIISKFKVFGGMKVIYGNPFDLSEYYGKKLTSDEIHSLTLKLMDTIYNIKEVK